MFNGKIKVGSQSNSKRFKNEFLGSKLELFSTDPSSTNQRISSISDPGRLGKLSFSGSLNDKGSIWVGHLKKSEFLEIPLDLLDQPARDHEWIELKILRTLVAMGHRIKGAEILIEANNYGVFTNRFIENWGFINSLNEVFEFNIQASKLLEIVDGAMESNFGKRKEEFFGVLSNLSNGNGVIKGHGLFSLGNKNPFLPLLFFSRKAFRTLWSHGIVKDDIEELAFWPEDYWMEFLSPLEQFSLGLFIDLKKWKAMQVQFRQSPIERVFHLLPSRILMKEVMPQLKDFFLIISGFSILLLFLFFQREGLNPKLFFAQPLAVSVLSILCYAMILAVEFSNGSSDSELSKNHRIEEDPEK